MVLSNSRYAAIKLNSKVFKDECVFSMDNPESDDGIFICLIKFFAISKKHIEQYSCITGFSLFLKYRIRKILKPASAIDEPVSKKPTRLGIGIEGGFQLPQDRYNVLEEWKLLDMSDGLLIDLPNSVSRDIFETCHLMGLDISNDLRKTIAFVQAAESAIISEEKEQAAAIWEADNQRPVSKFANSLIQQQNGIKIPPTGWKCCKCDLKVNLWLNLSDGSILCGRRFWDGSGGNNHALEHYHNTKYPLAVKLGTITPDGAEVYSYPEDQMITDLELPKHLAHWGIDILQMLKTDKTIAELEISANTRVGELLILRECQNQLQPRWGPGLTGLQNTGNSCYLNSVLQILFIMEPFKELVSNMPGIVNESIEKIEKDPNYSPLDDFQLQFCKIGEAMLSGIWSFSHNTVSELLACQTKGDIVQKLPGIKPTLFRRAAGRNHKEFSGRRMQDAYEYFEHIFDMLGNRKNIALKSLQFSVEERLQCGLTNKVRYTDIVQNILTLQVPNANSLEAVSFEDCFAQWSNMEKIDSWYSPASNPPGMQTYALRSLRLKNFPSYLLVRVARFQLNQNWQPIKLDTKLTAGKSGKELTLKQLNEWRLDLSCLRAHGLMPNEILMPESDANQRLMQPDIKTIEHLVEMGFSQESSMKACIETKNNSVEAATAWLMEHMTDKCLNEPQLQEIDDDSMQLLQSLGLSSEQATAVMMKFSGNLEQAADWVLCNLDKLESLVVTSEHKINGLTADEDRDPRLQDGNPVYKIIGFVSHMGKNTNEGHYVAHIRREESKMSEDDEWILFNDEKVLKSECPPFPSAYIYLLSRA